MRFRLFFALFALFATPATAATVQQDFDAAQAQLEAGDYYGARNAFTALLARFPAGTKGTAVSLVRAGLGGALVATNDPDGAVPMLEAALTGLKATTPAEADIRAVAQFDLGRAEESRGALDIAARQYRAVVDSHVFAANGAGDIGARAALARTLIWSNPVEARSLLDGLLALPESQLNGDQRALVMSLRGRVELNNGNALDAKRWFSEAATAAGGGETRSITVADIRIRGDLALANYALGNMKDVAKGMHFAGAGGDMPAVFSSAVSTPLPACAPLTGLATDTVAVVEFGIGEDGRAVGVTPIYASRGTGRDKPAAGDQGPEVLFVQAMRNWSWRGEDARKIPPFWRQSIRAEVRCLTQRPTDDPVLRSFSQDLAAWYDKTGLPALPTQPDTDSTDLTLIRTEMARREREFGPNSLQLLPALGAIASNSLSFDERIGAIDRWQQIAGAAPAPENLRLFWQMMKALTFGSVARDPAKAGRVVKGQLEDYLTQAEASGAGDTRAALAIRLMLGTYAKATGNNARAKQLFAAVADAPPAALAAGDPIRQKALLQQADIAARAGDIDAATEAFVATGLSAEQCALVDVRPQKINGTISEQTFPAMAKAWGNSGYVRTGFDISTDGQPLNVRTIIASPPFVFGPDTEKAIARFRYSPVFRPGNTVGCSAQTQSVRFVYGNF